MCHPPHPSHRPPPKTPSLRPAPPHGAGAFPDLRADPPGDTEEALGKGCAAGGLHKDEAGVAV
jgi:hypothetical protein